MTANGPGRIPKEFHFVFGIEKQREPFALAHFLCLESCRQVNEPSTIRFHYVHEPYGPWWDRIRPHLALEKVSPSRTVAEFRYRDRQVARYRYAHHADFIRLATLLEHGGVYADIDTLFVRPLPEALYRHEFVMGREGDVRSGWDSASMPSLCNALLMSAAGASFGRRWLERMPEAFDGSWSNHSTLLPRRLADEFPDEIHVEPQRSFFHVAPTVTALAGLFEASVPFPQDVLSVHLWEHLWWNAERSDYSNFHGGRLTAEYVRAGKTTYARLARPFLPADAEDVPAPFRTAWRRRSRELRVDAEAELRAAAGRFAYPLVARHVPRAAARLGLSRAYRTYRAARRRLTVRNAIEAALLRQVIQWDEYGIFGEALSADDVVIDVGAHIGAFSFACHALGSRSIHPFEAESANFALLERNLAGLAGITPTRGAVFRSDVPAEDAAPLTHSGPIFSNTGAGGVLFGTRQFQFLGVAADASLGQLKTVPTFPLDAVLRRFERVKLLKLDCEGSEFPILLTSRELARVDRIVGEYHAVTPAEMELMVPAARVPGYDSYRPKHLAARLEAEGFRLDVGLGSDRGLFNAERERT
jgi:FkbM family methyltransferase